MTCGGEMGGAGEVEGDVHEGDLAEGFAEAWWTSLI